MAKLLTTTKTPRFRPRWALISIAAMTLLSLCALVVQDVSPWVIVALAAVQLSVFTLAFLVSISYLKNNANNAKMQNDLIRIEKYIIQQQGNESSNLAKILASLEERSMQHKLDIFDKLDDNTQLIIALLHGQKTKLDDAVIAMNDTSNRNEILHDLARKRIREKHNLIQKSLKQKQMQDNAKYEFLKKKLRSINDDVKKNSKIKPIVTSRTQSNRSHRSPDSELASIQNQVTSEQRAVLRSAIFSLMRR